VVSVPLVGGEAMGDRRRDTVQSVDRAARILKALGAGSPRLGVTELADRVGLPKATIHGLLRALELQDFVARDTEPGKYRLGPALLQLGNAFLDTHELRSRSIPWAGSLASRAGEAVRVGVLTGATMLVVHHVFRPDDSVQILEVGASIPWHACALGRANVAYIDEQRRRTLLEVALTPLTGRTITDVGALRRLLSAVTRDGFAVEDQEAIVGESEIAAPVFDRHGVVAGAIGLVGPAERLTPDAHPQAAFVSAVKEAGRGLSRDMGAGRRTSPRAR
jgi:DNA-binding IclR family transcriptional regulator